ncbi:hypothetical protein B0H14DRAFT_2732331 [Mycena olivaceomarginata]|nr:hypothetical protein B0H14DRAFT_2732331 [Mycena olivaceomarginata]
MSTLTRRSPNSRPFHESRAEERSLARKTSISCTQSNAHEACGGCAEFSDGLWLSARDDFSGQSRKRQRQSSPAPSASDAASSQSTGSSVSASSVLAGASFSLSTSDTASSSRTTTLASSSLPMSSAPDSASSTDFTSTIPDTTSSGLPPTTTSTPTSITSTDDPATTPSSGASPTTTTSVITSTSPPLSATTESDTDSPTLTTTPSDASTTSPPFSATITESDSDSFPDSTPTTKTTSDTSTTSPPLSATTTNASDISSSVSTTGGMDIPSASSTATSVLATSADTTSVSASATSISASSIIFSSSALLSAPPPSSSHSSIQLTLRPGSPRWHFFPPPPRRDLCPFEVFPFPVHHRGFSTVLLPSTPTTSLDFTSTALGTHMGVVAVPGPPPAHCSPRQSCTHRAAASTPPCPQACSGRAARCHTTLRTTSARSSAVAIGGAVALILVVLAVFCACQRFRPRAHREFMLRPRGAWRSPIDGDSVYSLVSESVDDHGDTGMREARASQGYWGSAPPFLDAADISSSHTPDSIPSRSSLLNPPLAPSSSTVALPSPTTPQPEWPGLRGSITQSLPLAAEPLPSAAESTTAVADPLPSPATTEEPHVAEGLLRPSLTVLQSHSSRTFDDHVDYSRLIGAQRAGSGNTFDTASSKTGSSVQ